MPRIRSIRPDIGDDERWEAVSPMTWTTYHLLFTLADDAGRFRASPRLVRSRVFPFHPQVSDSDVAGILTELETIGKLRLYTVGGIAFAEVVDWDSEQKIDKPSPSTLPAYDDRDASDPDTTTIKLPRESSRSLATVRESSRSLATEGNGNGNGNGSYSGSSNRDAGLISERVKRVKTKPPEPSEVAELVALFVDQSAEAGLSPPLSNVRAQVGKQVRALIAGGRNPDTIRSAIGLMVTRNRPASALPYLVNDVERGRPAESGFAPQKSAAKLRAERRERWVADLPGAPPPTVIDINAIAVGGVR